MARKQRLRQDPWQELVSRKENRLVGLEEALPDLALEKAQARALKKALARRVNQVLRER